MSVTQKYVSQSWGKIIPMILKRQRQAHRKHYFPNCPADELMPAWTHKKIWAEMVLACYIVFSETQKQIETFLLHKISPYVKKQKLTSSEKCKKIIKLKHMYKVISLVILYYVRLKTHRRPVLNQTAVDLYFYFWVSVCKHQPRIGAEC